MPDYVYREDQPEVERWLSFYEWFVDSVRDGYDLCIHEYTNDLSSRERLEENRDTLEVKNVWSRVEAADAAFREILIPTKRPMSGGKPKTHFWFWGYPVGSPQLEFDLKSIDAI